MAKVIWLGDDDPAANVVTVGEYTFVKGEPIEVPDKDLGKIKDNPTFSTKAGAKPVEASEPSEEEREELAEQGTVKAHLRDQLRERGVTVTGNASEETLRKKLAEHVKKD